MICTLYPMVGIQGWQWVILAVVALLLFGGTRLAGLGKSAGRAIREFKEETDSLKKTDSDETPAVSDEAAPKAETKTEV